MSSSPGILDRKEVSRATECLHDYMRRASYAGYDPYDGLESSVLRSTGLLRWKWSRIGVLQLLKRSPWNPRTILGIPRMRNPKGIALVISALVKRHAATQDLRYLYEAEDLARWLVEEGSHDGGELAWGYPFDWQSRTFYARKGTPNTVCTVFCADALLNLYAATQQRALLNYAQRAVESFLLNMLREDGGRCYFRYVAHSPAVIHNVNLLAGSLCARIGCWTGNERLVTIGARALRYSCARQTACGAWPYGEARNLAWVDNFHTGFNLVALSLYSRFTGSAEFAPALERGLRYWGEAFFLPGGVPKYFPERVFPVDVHCAAQAVLTWLECRPGAAGVRRAAEAAHWALAHLRSPQGWFYFQLHRGYVNRIPYMRWGQSWMLLALAALEEAYAAGAGAFRDASVQEDALCLGQTCEAVRR